MAIDSLLIAVTIRDTELDRRVMRDLEALCSSTTGFADWNPTEVAIETFPTFDRLSSGLTAHFEAGSERYAIVVSDILVDGGKLATDARVTLGDNLNAALATLAIADSVARATDVDRVIPPTAGRDELREMLELLSARLRYIGPPKKHRQRRELRVRRIKDEFELSRYFRLRHDVYRAMGYLNERKEQVRSRLEIDGCDGNAIHLAAFERRDGFEILVGTARVLLSESSESSAAIWARQLLRSDPELEALVHNEALPLTLPVFHSQPLNHHLYEANRRGFLCAEISRVTVAYEYRGLGLSRLLLEHAIDEARQAQVHRLYLECLRLHESLYAKFGFRTLPDTGGEVIGFGRSMIAMVLELESSGASAA